jgi:tetratricopeptide (TPR) repeat protein
MPVNVGDAVLNFVGDSTQLDETFDSLPAKAQAGLQPVEDAQSGVTEGFNTMAAAGEDAGARMGTSMRGAREEVRFLSEEAGVRLPRAISGLVAELPGLGTAINLAFSATAIVFALQLLDTLEKKIIDLAFAGSNAQAQAAYQMLVAENNEYVKLNKAIEDADKALVAAIDTRSTLQKLQGQLIDQQQQLREATKTDESEILNAKRIDALNTQIRLTEVLIEKEKERLADSAEQDALKQIAAYEKNLEEVQDRYNRKVDETNRQMQELEKTLAEISAHSKEATIDVIQPEAVTKILEFRKAAQSLGVTLRSDLVAKLNEARIAKDLFVESMGTKDTQQIKLFDEAIQKAEKALQQFGDKSKVVENAFKSLQKELRSDAEDMAADLGSALEGALTGTKKVGQQLEKETISMVAGLCKQWGAYYVAKGIAIDADPTTAGAGTGLIVEGLALEALAGAISAAGNQIGGGASGSTSTGVAQLGVGSNTQGDGIRGGTSVRGFAEGGLVMQPTLALVGERPGSTEAVLPLDDAGAMDSIGKALAFHAAANGGGGATTNFNIKGGILSPDSVAKMVNKMNRMTRRGQLTLYSSNSLRVNRRSA